ncbi:MAG: hypothetical protein K9G44_06265 [Melioribacteraceae bacterium]|nr:hypothetical protein [Melioribacteraceae bacterium]
MKTIVLNATLFICTLFAGCSNSLPEKLKSAKGAADLLKESQTIEFKLPDELRDNSLEISGLDYYKDYLIILPQFPNKFGDKDFGVLFKVSRSEIRKSIADTNYVLKYEKIKLISEGLEKYTDSFGSGFEAIHFLDNLAFFLIEHFSISGTNGFLVKGEVDDDLSVIRLDQNAIVKIESQTDLSNTGEEALTINNNSIYVFHEANGEYVNSRPVTNIFDLHLNLLESVNMPTIEYRITDATRVDKDGRFWMINYMWDGDYDLLKPREDKLIQKFGIGKSHANSGIVERLLEFRLKNGDVELTDKPPIYISLNENLVGNNWEGIARFENGFILATDYFPKTKLVFIPVNQ